MWKVGDPVIKLFGKTIPLPPNQEASAATHQHHHQVLLSCTSEDQNSVLVGEDQNGDNQIPSKSELTNTTRGEEISSCPTAEDSIYPATSGGNSETQSVDRVTSTPKPGKNEEHTESSSSQEKTLKKPDKILPCPRCNSMDTKFCYYNNYNVNQPRYFCKKCQRYWTSGGTMRNVPVGSGRRKNKSSALHFRHLIVSEALHGAQADALKANANVLAFGSESDAPLFQSMASALNLADNGLLRPEQRMSSSCGGNKSGDDNSIGSSITASISIEKGGNAGLQETIPKHFKSFPPQVPCFLGPPWAYQWNNAAQWTPPALIQPPGYPLPFHPASPYWGCTLTAASWNMPWLPPQPSSPNQSAASSIPSSPTLGKHSRDGDMLKLSNSEKEGTLKESNSENCIWVPKTLRIDDPSEAAKSSIWSTLGIKNERSDSIYGGGLFKGFQSKGYDNNLVAETSPVLQANPAALSRSLNFHEST